MSLHLYLKCWISYIFQVTHYWDPMALVWVELQLSIWIFWLKLRMMYISMSYLIWVLLPFYYSIMVCYLFAYSHPDLFLYCCLYSEFDNSSGRYLLWGERYWGYSYYYVRYYNFCFCSMFSSCFLCEACVTTYHWITTSS